MSNTRKFFINFTKEMLSLNSFKSLLPTHTAFLLYLFLSAHALSPLSLSREAVTPHCCSSFSNILICLFYFFTREASQLVLTVGLIFLFSFFFVGKGNPNASEELNKTNLKLRFYFPNVFGSLSSVYFNFTLIAYDKLFLALNGKLFNPVSYCHDKLMEIGREILMKKTFAIWENLLIVILTWR